LRVEITAEIDFTNTEMLSDANRRQRTRLDEPVHGHRRDPNVIGNFPNREQVVICAHLFTSDPQSTRHNPFGINGRSTHQPDIGTTWAGVEHFVAVNSESRLTAAWPRACGSTQAAVGRY
jgi:hypothetical protein